MSSAALSVLWRSLGGVGLLIASGVPQSIRSSERPFPGGSNVPLATVGGVLLLLAVGVAIALGVARENDKIDRLRDR